MIVNLLNHECVNIKEKRMIDIECSKCRWSVSIVPKTICECFQREEEYEECKYCRMLYNKMKSYEDKLKGLSKDIDWEIPFGKYKGKLFRDIIENDIKYVEWMCGLSSFTGKLRLKDLVRNTDKLKEMNIEIGKMQRYLDTKLKLIDL